MIRCRQDNQIFHTIVQGVFIDMVHMLAFFQGASKLLFHHDTMFKRPSSRRRNFDYPIPQMPHVMQSSTAKGPRLGMVHAMMRFGWMPCALLAKGTGRRKARKAFISSMDLIGFTRVSAPTLTAFPLRIQAFSH